MVIVNIASMIDWYFTDTARTHFSYLVDWVMILARVHNVWVCECFLFVLQCGTEDVKRHRWFKHIDWADVFMKKLQVTIECCIYCHIYIYINPSRFFMDYEINEQMYRLMVTDYRRPWTRATPEQSQVQCQLSNFKGKGKVVVSGGYLIQYKIVNFLQVTNLCCSYICLAKCTNLLYLWQLINQNFMKDLLYGI